MFRGIALGLALLPAAALAESLTLVGPNNGHFDGSIFFDLTAQTDLTITSLDYYVRRAEPGTPLTVEIYTRQGSYVGYDTDPSAWTLHDVGQVISNGNNTLVSLILTSPLSLQAGTTTGVYFVPQGGLQYNSSGPAQQGNADLTLFGDLVRTAPWGGATFEPRTLSGTIHYVYGGSPDCYADCDINEVLNVNDFLCFIDEFAQGQTLPISQQITHYANCTGATAEPVLTVNDFLCFIDEFAQGCP